MALGQLALPMLLLLSVALLVAALVPAGLVVKGVGVVAAVMVGLLRVLAVLLSPLWLAVSLLSCGLRRRDPVAVKSPTAPVAG